jgi:hypothetical protein
MIRSVASTFAAMARRILLPLQRALGVPSQDACRIVSRLCGLANQLIRPRARYIGPAPVAALVTKATNNTKTTQ